MNRGIFPLRAISFRILGLGLFVGTLSFGAWTVSVVNSQGTTFSDRQDFWQYGGTPTGRSMHLAFWTGSELIVWGGYNQASPPYRGAVVRDAARYNPVLGKWSLLSETNAPGGRTSATAVWTGREMIVWGGIGENLGYLNTGARYQPGGDTWSAVSTNGTPSRRGYHTAVWTGTEMLIWGGTDVSTGSGILSTGAAYNPTTDTWRPIPSQGAPVRRWSHLAVWTGSECLFGAAMELIAP